MWSVQWRLDQGQQEAHNRAFEAVQGVPWSVRFDNCKTAVVRRGGPWAILNDDYASYARQLAFVPDACRIRRPTDKGKVERRLRDVRWNLIRANERFETLADLQTTSDRPVRESAERLRCPDRPVGGRVLATGTAPSGAAAPDLAHLAAGLGVKRCKTASPWPS